MSDQLSNKHQAWSARFAEPVSALVQRYNASVHFDQRLAMADIEGSQAHAKMLAEQHIISIDDYHLIVQGLQQIRTEITQGRFEWSQALEDVHLNIEQRLTEICVQKGNAEAAKHLHTARSRNDQVATDTRLWLRAELDDLRTLIKHLQLALVQLASEHIHTLMPGFTHLQVAQPISFAHHLLAYVEMLQRDLERMSDCRKRLNRLPLGAAALAGTSFDINRERTRELLQFDAICTNSLDAVSDRDFAIEFCAVASMLMMHLSRFSEELIFWMSTPVRFIELPDRFCTGSSIMPQKKNPDVPELARGKTARVYGHLIALLTLMKAQPLAYNKDNQEDKEPLFDCVDTLRDTLRVFIEMVPGITPCKQRLAEFAEQGFATATDLADHLVRAGVAFRDAHEVVAQAVRLCVQRQIALHELTQAQLQSLHPKLTTQVLQQLTAQASMASRKHVGGTAPNTVNQAVQHWLTQLVEH